MTCQICGDTQGPFEFADVKDRVKLVCEDCAKKYGKKYKKTKKLSKYYEYSMGR